MMQKTRKIIAAAAFALLPFYPSAQDLAINPSIVAPVSGCYLSSNTTVTVIIVNTLASPYGGTFDISYSLNGGAPVVETITAVLSPSGTYIYSFLATADLSACQMHTFDFNLAVTGDVNPSNNSLSVSIASDCDPVPGSITYPTTVCSGINSGNLTLGGYSGNIQDWIYSEDSGSTWVSTGNTTDTQPYNNITMQTQWQVIVGSPYGYCADDSTAVVTIDIVPQSVAGTLPADFDICDNGNSGVIHLTGYLGDVLGWETSQDGGATWTPVANTSDSLTYSGLSDTTLYQVQVQNDICPAVYSAPITLTLIPGSDAGSIVGELLVCNFENDSSLEVNPVIGNAVDWYVSYDNGSTWMSTGVADSIYAYNGLLSYTLFAAIVQEANCPYDTAFHSIVVLPLAITAGPDVSIYEEDTTQLVASGGIDYQWFPANDMSDPTIYNPQVYPLVTTEYFVQVTDINGCVDTASVTVTVLPDIESIIIPNLLTPNGDGYNDYLTIPNIDTYPGNELYIFNSYGQVIFQASPYNNNWDATYNGSNVPDGTYYYILNLNDAVAAPDPFQGVITIIGND